MRVLLVDDEADLASALADRLGMRGIEADWATNGRQALDRAAAKPYDLAVLDVKMPGIGGLELRERLQSLYPRMKFIFLTGYGSETDFRQVSSIEGEACYLVKPVDIQDLIQLMNDLTQGQGGPP
jgi:DNA-binding response OmpR family regulator